MSVMKPVALIILDGWGLRDTEFGNSVALASTPNYDRWTRTLERSILDASGRAVGLPAGQMGNSEVGHLNLGAGRVVPQDITRINDAIANDTLAANPALKESLDWARSTGASVHMIGLLGTGGVHSHSDHLAALALEAANYAPLNLHLLTDGRDTPPDASPRFLADLEQALVSATNITIASLSGRYYAMDRDRRWERTQHAFDAFVGGKGDKASSAAQAIENAHAAAKTDEFIPPTVIGDPAATRIGAGDLVIFANFRADRMRQLLSALANPTFDHFDRPFDSVARALTMTQYFDGQPADVLFQPNRLTNTLGAVIADAGRTQFHAAETEKYAHVTYFFNGGTEDHFPGEERSLIPSPKVATYDLQPEMSAPELADSVLRRLESRDDDFILVNFANPDMVGHTGDLQAASRAVEAADTYAGKVVDAIVKKGGVALVTADHGNAERLMMPDGSPHTFHTTSAVPLFAVGADLQLRDLGILADVAPTILELMALEQPDEMTGSSLLHRLT